MPENIETETETDVTAEDVNDATSTDTDDDTTPEGADSLGDAGKRALDSMKSKWKVERDRRRELETQLANAASTAPKDDSEAPDVDAIKRQAATEATAKANARILRSEIKAAAAGKFADVSDALLNLDLTAFEVDENGDVDADEIAEQIQDLLTRKPHLAAAKAKRFQGSGDGGAARKASGPSQLTSDDLRGMTPAQIVKAKADGRLNGILGIG